MTWKNGRGWRKTFKGREYRCPATAETNRAFLEAFVRWKAGAVAEGSTITPRRAENEQALRLRRAMWQASRLELQRLAGDAESDSVDREFLLTHDPLDTVQVTRASSEQVAPRIAYRLGRDDKSFAGVRGDLRPSTNLTCVDWASACGV